MEVLVATGVMSLAAVPASIYYHGPYGLVISIVWGAAGGIVGSIGFYLGFTLRNGVYKSRGGFAPDLGILRYWFLAGMAGMATFVTETWMASTVASDNMETRITFMSKASAGLGLLATLAGVATKY
eukprot:TRINITY_DN28596_c0_g1_i1.p1 TRINITY_DN28596_c0_g1~~TRINITY_DN28596_c0_g1_i1.p1  ORF type:complete len:148 (+),score=10.09 TRINITY_DN28596_c0_g1_i1:68-445(+)